MDINVESTAIDQIKVITPQVFQDDRGFFLEVFRKDVFEKHGLPTQFVQANHSGSVKNTIRGLHFQWDPPMGKFMRVSRGEAFLVAVDIRKDSPTFSKWYGHRCSDKNRVMIWASAGFARGFAVISDYAEIQYLCTGTYNQQGESGILWNDPALDIKWPVENPILSAKDEKAQTLAQWAEKAESDHFKV